LSIHCPSNCGIHLGSKSQVLLHARTTKVDVAVLQSCGFIDVGSIINAKWWWLGGIENSNNAVVKFNFTGGQVRVHCASGPRCDRSRDLDDVFTTDINRAFNNALDNPGVVAEVKERQVLAVLTTLAHPAAQHHLLANI
jgi:hypothetical protein